MAKLPTDFLGSMMSREECKKSLLQLERKYSRMELSVMIFISSGSMLRLLFLYEPTFLINKLVNLLIFKQCNSQIGKSIYTPKMPFIRSKLKHQNEDKGP